MQPGDLVVKYIIYLYIIHGVSSLALYLHKLLAATVHVYLAL